MAGVYADVDDMRHSLSNYSLKGDWKEVVDIYKESREAHTIQITSMKETALHVAIEFGKEDIVKKLVEEIKKHREGDDASEPLRIKNKRGYTPLHVAASRGSMTVCECMLRVATSLLNERDELGQTPLFLAALYGHKNIFISFHEKSAPHGIANCRRNDGETVLHQTIYREHFELAFHIIHLYGEDIVNVRNSEGVTPLTVLASKPLAFKSCTFLRWWEEIMYYSIDVPLLKPDTRSTDPSIPTKYDNFKQKFPQNYHTILDFFAMLWDMIRVGSLSSQHTRAPDTENPVPGGIAAPNSESLSSQHSKADTENHVSGGNAAPQQEEEEYRSFPANYATCYEFFKFICVYTLGLAGYGFTSMGKIKEKHIICRQILNELIERDDQYKEVGAGDTPLDPNINWQDFDDMLGPDYRQDQELNPQGEKVGAPVGDTDKNNKEESEFLLKIKKAFVGETSTYDSRDNNDKDECTFLLTIEKKNKVEETRKEEKPILVAAKYGVEEIVEAILNKFPLAIHDTTDDGKNVLLVAVENKQPFLISKLKKRPFWSTLIEGADKEGNNVMHLAAFMRRQTDWQKSGAAMHMQWEMKWYEFVKDRMPSHFLFRNNKDGLTPEDIFNKDHKDLAESSGEWFKRTSESCSVVAALIATVAFATSSSIPGGTDDKTGKPKLEGQPAFNVFAITSLVALCFSVTALIMFLAILTSRYQTRDFSADLPRKLLFGYTSLFVSIASVLVSFCAGHFFEIHDKLKQAAFPIYAITCLPVTFFAVAQFPIYIDLVSASFLRLPHLDPGAIVGAQASRPKYQKP